MLFPDKYSSHNESLERFVAKFNAIGDPDLHIWLPPCENFYDDGTIYYDEPDCFTSYRILFDWEKRHTHYYDVGKFPFRTLTQLGRKIVKREITLSLQTSKNEAGLMVAFHDDFEEDAWRMQWVEVEDGSRKLEKVFETTQFIEYDISKQEGILALKEMLKRAILSRQFNSMSFAS